MAEWKDMYEVEALSELVGRKVSAFKSYRGGGPLGYLVICFEDGRALTITSYDIAELDLEIDTHPYT